MDAACILFSLHGEVLRELSAIFGTHFTGLAQAASHGHKMGCFSNGHTKKLRNLDTTCAVLRHVTIVFAQSLKDEIIMAAKPYTPFNVHAAEFVPASSNAYVPGVHGVKRETTDGLQEATLDMMDVTDIVEASKCDGAEVAPDSAVTEGADGVTHHEAIPGPAPITGGGGAAGGRDQSVDGPPTPRVPATLPSPPAPSSSSALASAVTSWFTDATDEQVREVVDQIWRSIRGDLHGPMKTSAQKRLVQYGVSMKDDGKEIQDLVADVVYQAAWPAFCRCLLAV